MKRKNTANQRNIKVFAVNDGNNPGFSIILEFSGQREFLLHHKHNGLLYNLLKDGIRLEELRRHKPKGSSSLSPYYHGIQRSRSTKLNSMVSHLLTVIDTYIEERITGNEQEVEMSNSKHSRTKITLSEVKTAMHLERSAA